MVGPARYGSLTHRLSSHPTAGVVAGLLLGLLLAGVLVVRDVSVGDEVAPKATSGTTRPDDIERPADIEAFLDAWERSRSGTWLARLRFTRRTTAGTDLVDELRIAQRPPDRLTVGPLGAVAGRVDGRIINCATGSTGALRCGPGEPAPDYEKEVADEVAILRGYFEAPLSLYSVRADGECFALRLARAYPSPPYGERARFCFDRDTGAPTRQEIQRREGSDVQEAIELRAEVTDADLEPPPSAP
jgi:hypothetical protein